MAVSLGNNLIVQSILSPALDLGDATPVDHTTQGEINKRTLLNRVKKMTQADRQELVAALQQIHPVTQLPENTPPLREKGISTLILADDGEKAEGHSFLVSFFRGLCNRFGDRISSAVVMEKIHNTKLALVNQRHDRLMNPELAINWALSSLQQRIDLPHPSDQIQPLVEEIANLKREFATASELDWSAFPTFLNFSGSLKTFNTKIKGRVSFQICAEIEEELNKIDQIIRARTGSSDIQGWAQKIKADVLPNLHPFLIPEEWEENFDALSKGLKLEKKGQFDYWKNKFVIPLINLRFLSIEMKLKNIIRSFDAEKLKMEKERELIQKRLETYQSNISKVVKRGEFRKAHLAIEHGTKQLDHLNSICGLLNYLVGLKGKSFAEFKIYLHCAYEQYLRSQDKELKARGNFGQIFDLLTRYINGDTTLNIQPLADSLDKLNALEDKDLASRLNVFKSTPTIYQVDDHKQYFINDYIAYMKFIFDGLKSTNETALKEAKERQNQLNEVLKPQLPVKLKPVILPTNQPSVVVVNPPRTTLLAQPVPLTILNTSTPVISRPVPVVSSDGLPSVLEIPKQGNASLRGMADNIQKNRSNDSLARNFYIQFTEPTVPQSLVNNVCGNFYWIMKDAGKLCGPLNAEGHSQDSNWGGKVFTIGSLNGVDPSVARPLLNHYRVQAIVEVLQGRIRTGAHQVFSV